MSSRAQRGFTLVELLVALFALAILAVLSYRGIDGMARAREQTQAHADSTLSAQVGLAQWQADLDAIVALPGLKAIEWNGRVLRITRRSTARVTDGVVIAAWTRRVVNGQGMWMRWQSPPATTRGDLDQAWQRADLWSQNPSDEERAREVSVLPLQDWQIFFYRQNAWTNPQSSGITTSSIAATPPAAPAPQGASAPVPSGIPPAQALPDGVRLVIVLPPGQALQGTIVRDWVRPELT